jgi:predicted MPP superfamily phosphohydrolase
VAGLSVIQSPDGVYAVLGNHDHWTDAVAARHILELCGVVELQNTVTILQRQSAILHLAGVDDHWARASNLDDVLTVLPEDDQAVILLAHEPDFADVSAATGRFDLQLSGHSHAGQFLIPLLNRPIITPKHGHKYPVGEYRVGVMIQYTNRGLGTIYPAFRLNCLPEITLITLRSPST